MRYPLLAAIALAALAALSLPASAGPGSGAAAIAPSASVVAGSTGTWTLDYVAAEDFNAALGGGVAFDLPAGWTAPQRSDASAPGYVEVTSPAAIDSVWVSGSSVFVHVGSPAGSAFLTGDTIRVVYGSGGGPASAVAGTVAPSTALFLVSSDPTDTLGVSPLSASPSLAVVPGVVTHVRVVDPSMAPVGAFTRSADEDTTQLRLRGYDAFDNPARMVAGSWSVTGGIGTVSPATGIGTVLTLTSAATGYAVGDSGAWSASTGLITVTHGAFAGLAMNADAIATAGVPFGANITAVDSDANAITSGPGSGATITFVGYADSTGGAPADPDFASATVTLGSGTWNATRTARRSGTFWLAVRDSATGLESPRRRIDVSAAAPDHIAAKLDTLALTAGVPSTLTILVFDALGNRAPTMSSELLTLWTDRPAGRFVDSFGSIIHEAILPVGADSVDLRYADNQAGAGVGRLRAIDADGAGSSLGTAAAYSVTSPGPPTGLVSLTASPDTLMADGVDSSFVVSGLITDAYGNPIPAGLRFTATSSLVTPYGDVDPGAPGVQWATAPGGTVSGWVRAGLATGAGSVSVQLGAANGSIGVWLVAGVPAGVIAVTASPDSLAADSVSTRTVTASGLHDANGNPVVDGEAYTVTTTLGSIASADQDAVTPGVQRRASGGSISFSLFGGDVLGTAAVGVTSVRGSASGSANVRLVPGAVSALASSVVAASPAPVGAAGSTITATLRDSQGHPLPGVPSDSLTVVVLGVAAAVTPLAASTDAGGAIAFRATATVAGSGVVSVVAKGVALSSAPTIVFVPGPLDHYALSAPGGPLTAGISDSLTLYARDAFNNPMPALSGVALRPVVLGGAAVVPDSAMLASGSGTVVFTPTLAAPLTIQVHDDAARSVTYGPASVAPGAPYRLIALAPPSGSLSAGDSMAVQARLFDAYGNAVPSGSVGASIVAGSGSVSPATDATDAGGLADFKIHAGSAPGPLTLRMLATASAAEDSIRADSIFVTVNPAATASLQVIADSLNWTAGVAVRVRVRPLDAFGNLVTADTATVVMRPAGAAGWSPPFGPLSGGTFTTFATDTVAESVSLAADRVGGGTGSAGPAVVSAAAPAQLALVSGDAQSAIVDHNLAAPLRVRARDAYGNVAPGASVVFTVASGNGFVDAVAGGAADSIAAGDGSGVATCDVARLGTVSGAGSDSFRARLLLAPAAQVLFTATATPDAAASLTVLPPSLSLAAGATANVTVQARDSFGNLAPGTPVTFFLGSPALGALESTGATSGGSGSQSGVTGGVGTLTVRYHAPSSAPAADSIYARGVTIAPVGIRATVSASATASLLVLPDSSSWIAGSPVRVRVRAVDSFGNLAVGDTATVVMRLSGAASWAPRFGSMTAGEFITFATDTLAETLSSLDADRVGGGTGSAGPVTVRPAAPAGSIAIAAPRDTLTADGKSSVTVTLGPVRDAYGNVAATGSLVLVSATSASLLAPDASPLPGLDLATAADGRASVILTAPAAAGLDTLRASSRAGSASGPRPFVYLPPPSLAYAAGSITPVVVVPGSSYAFRAAVTNTGSGTLQIGAGTTVSFGSGPAAYAATLSAPLALGAGATDTLRFAGVAVSPSLTPGSYAPSLRAVGLDGSGDPLDFYLNLAGAQTHVAGIAVAAVSASPSPAPLGHTDLSLVFDVTNRTALPATIDATSLGYSTGAFTTNGVTPTLPAALAASGVTRLTISVRVPSSGIPSGTLVNATLTATANFSGSSVTGANGTPLSFQIVSAAQLAAKTGGALPVRYLRARTFGPTVRVANVGSSAVTLAKGATRLVLSHPGGDVLTTGLSAATAVAGGDSAVLAFDSLAVGATVARGRYGARLELSGTESGLAFADTIPLDPDSVSVLEPPLLAVSAPLSPDTVSAGQGRPIQVTLSNAGDIAFDLDAGTALRFGAPLSTTLSLGAAASVGPGASLNLNFAGQPLGSPLAPGTGAATLDVQGTEDGRARAQAVPAGALVAQAPAALAFVAGSATPDTVRAGQSYALTAAVRNNGGSAFVLNPAATRIVVTDGVEQAVAFAAGAPVALGPGAQTTLSFPSVAFPAALASQPYPVSLEVYGTEWALAESVSVASPPSEILVIEPAAGVQVRAIDAGAPVQVSSGQVVRAWALEVTPVLPPGGVTSAHLTTLRLNVLVDGGSGAPSSALAAISLRNAAGALIAQSAAGGANPITLALTVPLALTAPSESLYVDVAVSGAAAARDVALRLAAAGDLVVLDDLAGTPVPVVGGGGLAFASLTSPTITLFAKAHGYPNPFHAGREAVLLSYLLPQDGPVKVSIYTLLGDLVREIPLQAGAAGGTRGLNEVPWDGRNGRGDLVRPGLYVARIEGSGANEQIKVGVTR